MPPEQKAASILPLTHCPAILQSSVQHAHPGDGSQSSPIKMKNKQNV